MLHVDAKTVTKRYKLLESQRLITVQPTREDYLEIKLPDLVVALKSQAKASEAVPPKSKDEKNVKADPNQPPP